MENDKDWIAACTGGAVTRFEKTTAGRSRATWIVDVENPDGSTSELVLRRDTGDGPLSQTELSLERESNVYRALSDTAVPIPRLVEVSDDSLALLVERIGGTEELNALSSAEREKLIGSFVDAVVELHAVEVDQLDLPGFHRPSGADDHALGDLALWTTIVEERVGEPLPILTMVLRWLAANPPAGPDRTVLCHGDLGPGNFMQADGDLTGLLDWEFAHLGDPMDDLAWLSIRVAQLGGMGETDDLIDLYHHRSGTAIDASRVRYYQLFVLARMAIACSVALERKASGAMDLSTYFMLTPLLQSQMATMLAELAGFELEPAELVEPDQPTIGSAIVTSLSTDLGSVLGPELQTDSARARMMGMMILLSHLAVADTLGERIRRADADELAVLLGARPSSVADGEGRLNEAINNESIPFAAVLQYLHRRASRQVQLWPIIAPLAAQPLPVVASRP